MGHQKWLGYAWLTEELGGVGVKWSRFQHAWSVRSSSHLPPRFFRAALLASWPSFSSLSLGSSTSGAGWASWFSLLSPPSWLLSDFLSLFFSFSLREEGGGFFALLLMTFCCCWSVQVTIFHKCMFRVPANTRLFTENSGFCGHLWVFFSFVCRDCCLQFYSISINFQEKKQAMKTENS